MTLHLICYDIADPKRLAKVRKVAYDYAFGGQKSAVESYLTSKQLKKLLQEFSPLIDPDVDRINIIKVHKRPFCLAKQSSSILIKELLSYEQTLH